MFWHSEIYYEEVRRSQQELRDRMARAQMVARARREAAQARPARSSRSRWAARLRAALTRP